MDVRECKTSAEARSYGFSTVQWLRAFTFTEHAAREDRQRCRQRRWQDAVLPMWEDSYGVATPAT
jgi:hypothetical protein